MYTYVGIYVYINVNKYGCTYVSKYMWLCMYTFMKIKKTLVCMQKYVYITY